MVDTRGFPVQSIFEIQSYKLWQFLGWMSVPEDNSRKTLSFALWAFGSALFSSFVFHERQNVFVTEFSQLASCQQFGTLKTLFHFVLSLVACSSCLCFRICNSFKNVVGLLCILLRSISLVEHHSHTCLREAFYYPELLLRDHTLKPPKKALLFERI